MTYRSLFIISVYVMLIWPTPAQAEIERFDVPMADSPSLGPTDAPVTIIEFLDYQ